jgi:hypothetical protein
MNWSCRLWGHHVDNRVFSIEPESRQCRCGANYLRRDGSLTRVRHTLSCFLGKHTYAPLADRDGCREYVCVQCGHPLVFIDGADPYRRLPGFRKKVRYLCGLFGHRAVEVARRDGAIEYACHCGPHVPQGAGTGPHHPPSARVRPARTLPPLRHRAHGLRRVRLRQLWTSVLFRRRVRTISTRRRVVSSGA